MISRRKALKTMGAAVVAAPMLRIDAGAQASALDQKTLDAIAEVVLPADCDRQAAVAAFARWIRNYHEGADMDHGYGFTRIRATGPSPAKDYSAQFAALDAAARAAGAPAFVSVPLAARRTIVEKALADAKIERLPQRPNGQHVAADLMAHYFHSPDAEDLCYDAAIGRDSCRGLPGSEKAPAPLRSGTEHRAPSTTHRASSTGV
jgi:hypothetical protein